MMEKMYGKDQAARIMRDARSAVRSQYVETWQYRKCGSIHAVSEQSLRMPGIHHVDALPPTLRGIAIVVRKGNHVSCPWEHADDVQNMGNRHSDPFGNEGPALLANMIGDLAAR